MQPNVATEPSQPSPSLLIERTTLWDNSSKDDETNPEKCVAPLTDHAWQTVGSLKELIDTKYGLNSHQVSNLFDAFQGEITLSLSPQGSS